jgi:hypothetical protein
MHRQGSPPFAQACETKSSDDLGMTIVARPTAVEHRNRKDGIGDTAGHNTSVGAGMAKRIAQSLLYKPVDTNLHGMRDLAGHRAIDDIHFCASSCLIT